MLKVVMRTVIVVVVFLCIGKAIPVKAQAEPCGGKPILISELQTGAAGISGTTNFRYEFLEIYNCTATKLALDGYSVAFKSIQGQQTAVVALHGELEAKSFLWIAHNSYKTFVGENVFTPSISFAANNGNLNALAADGGAVVLSDAADTVLDTVVFGTQTTMALVPPAGQSIKRCTIRGSFADTNNNAKDFVVTALPTLSALFKLGPACVAPPEEEPVEQEPACNRLSINEILPNPSGSDEGKEFIELYNPTISAISLKGCSLRLGETGKIFQLPHETLQPGTYRIFSDSESGLTLPNKTGDTVWLLSSTNEQGVKYADNLADDQAWALIDTAWKATYQVTPLAFNKFLEDLPGKGALEEECVEGQERNPDTNRCRKIVTPVLQACKPGQERSIETNRCRTIVTAMSGLAPCQPGQERNLATNRCRRVAAVDDELKPCPAGQERNPETNRCRKIIVAHTSGLDKIQEVQDSGASDPRWWLAGVAAVGVAGYGLYEWRHDIAQRFGKLKQKVGGKK